MPFMLPQIVERETIADILPELAENEHVEGLDEKQLQSPYFWRLSAPGYLDCTDWTPAESVLEAISDCMGMYGDGFDEFDYRELMSYLNGFNDFLEGHLVALAFTGHRISDPEDSEPEPLYHHPGGNIRDVVSGDEIWDLLDDDQKLSVMSDCVNFFVEAYEMIGDDPEQAGTDFHFTRNGHGVGFWDRPEIYGDENAHKLTELSEPYGTCELKLYVDENGNELYQLIN